MSSPLPPEHSMIPPRRDGVVAGDRVVCPACQGGESTALNWTWWGGFIGPRMLSHVRCRHCGTTYNGRTGRSNTAAILAFNLVLGAIMLFVVAVVVVTLLLLVILPASTVGGG